MGITVNHPGDSCPATKRRGQHARAEVIATAARFAAQGRDFADVARELGMDPKPKGALSVALRRAGHVDLLRVLQSPQRVPADQVVAIADRILAGLPDSDEVAVQRRQREAPADEVPVEPAGRKIRGPGGIVRWVA